MDPKTELAQALLRHEPQITLDARGVYGNIFRDAVAQNVKLAYYVNSMTTSMSYAGMPRVVFHVQYHNTEVSPSDIFVVSSIEEVQSILCQYIGNYKTRLVLLAGYGVDVAFAYNKFVETTAPFYSNFVGARLIKGAPAMLPMHYYDFYFDYRIGKVKLAMMENETDAEVERLAKQMFLPGMSDETKAFLAHNYLAYTIDYTLKENASSLEKSYMQSAYGALIKKKCVCQGYAEAFKRLMDYAGIPCDIVCGKTDGSAVYHAWNILKLHGERENYHIDVTWDSSPSGVSYQYFGLKDSDFYGKRAWNMEYNAKCNSPKSLLLEARRGIMRFKAQLMANGVDVHVMGY